MPRELLDPIIVVDSELDDVPNERAARLWNSEALQEKLRERDLYLQDVREELLESFSALAKHLRSQDLGGGKDK